MDEPLLIVSLDVNVTLVDQGNIVTGELSAEEPCQFETEVHIVIIENQDHQG